MNKQLSFEVRKRLQTGDLGDEIEPGFHMADIGRVPGEDSAPAIRTETINTLKPKTRQERIRLADSMAARLMDQYMEPTALNDLNVLNPIRDGIPQCSAHPFVVGDSKKIGCIHGCGHREREGSAGSLPVARDGTVADVWQWVQALVRKAVEDGDHRAGFRR